MKVFGELSMLLKKVVIFAEKNKPTIMTVIEMVGIVDLGIISFDSGRKFEKEIVQEEQDLTLKKAAEIFAPPIISGVLVEACAFGSNAEHLKREAALATAYITRDTQLKEYKDKVADKFGKRKEEKVNEDIYRDRIEDYLNSGLPIILTGNGTQPCYDPWTGKMFYSDINAIKRAVNAINDRITRSAYNSASLSDFYEELGIPYQYHGKVSELNGWSSYSGMLDVKYSSVLIDDVVYLVMDYDIDLTFGVGE